MESGDLDNAKLQKYHIGKLDSLRIENYGKSLDIIRWSDDILSIIINNNEPALRVNLKRLNKLPINLTAEHKYENFQHR